MFFLVTTINEPISRHWCHENSDFHLAYGQLKALLVLVLVLACVRSKLCKSTAEKATIRNFEMVMPFATTLKSTVLKLEHYSWIKMKFVVYIMLRYVDNILR